MCYSRFLCGILLQIQTSNNSSTVVNRTTVVNLSRAMVQVLVLVNLNQAIPVAIPVAIRLSNRAIHRNSPPTHRRALIQAMVDQVMPIQKRRVSNSMMKVFAVDSFVKSMQF